MLNSVLSQNNPYMLGEIKTDNKDFVILSFENYIVGDTGNYNYLPNAIFIPMTMAKSTIHLFHLL